GGGGRVGSSIAAAFWRSPHSRLFGAVTRRPSLYAHQICAPGAFPSTSHHGGALSGDLLPFRGQGRSQRHGILAGFTAASSRTPAPAAARHRRNPAVAVSG